MADNKLQKPPASPALAIREMIMGRLPTIKAVLPAGYDAARFATVALSNIARNPALANCTPLSFYTAVHWLAQLGLDPGGPDQLAYLVPYKETCTPQVGYRGLIQLALQGGGVDKISAVVVYSKDTFEQIEGFEPRIVHVIPRLGSDRGEKIGVYAWAKLANGSTVSHVMDKAEIEKHKARSMAAKSDKDTINMWRDAEDEAWRKTAVRMLYKYLPRSPAMSKAIAHQENVEAGKPTEFKEFEVADLDTLPTKGNELADRLEAAEATATIPEAVIEPPADPPALNDQDREMDNVLALIREANSALELQAPRNLIKSRLKRQKDIDAATKLADEREAAIGAAGRRK